MINTSKGVGHLPYAVNGNLHHTGVVHGGQQGAQQQQFAQQTSQQTAQHSGGTFVASAQIGGGADQGQRRWRGPLSGSPKPKKSPTVTGPSTSSSFTQDGRAHPPGPEVVADDEPSADSSAGEGEGEGTSAAGTTTSEQGGVQQDHGSWSSADSYEPWEDWYAPDDGFRGGVEADGPLDPGADWTASDFGEEYWDSSSPKSVGKPVGNPMRESSRRTPPAARAGSEAGAQSTVWDSDPMRQESFAPADLSQDGEGGLNIAHSTPSATSDIVEESIGTGVFAPRGGVESSLSQMRVGTSTTALGGPRRGIRSPTTRTTARSSSTSSDVETEHGKLSQGRGARKVRLAARKSRRGKAIPIPPVRRRRRRRRRAPPVPPAPPVTPHPHRRRAPSAIQRYSYSEPTARRGADDIASQLGEVLLVVSFHTVVIA